MQAALAAKVDRPTRKLRKERKNRSKKVRLRSQSPTPPIVYMFAGPRDGQVEGCRASEEGQVEAASRTESLLLPLSPLHRVGFVVYRMVVCLPITGTSQQCTCYASHALLLLSRCNRSSTTLNASERSNRVYIAIVYEDKTIVWANPIR
jgi:hypothetical protein